MSNPKPAFSELGIITNEWTIKPTPPTTSLGAGYPVGVFLPSLFKALCYTSLEGQTYLGLSLSTLNQLACIKH